MIAILRRAAAAICLAALSSACADPERDRLKQTTQASYDANTGRLKELTFDANKNNRIDTWTEMDGARPVRSRIDRNEDGKIDRWEYYDEKGQLLKVGLSRPDDGTPDAWAYQGPSGRIERIESSSARDEKRIDRWEQYAPAVGTEDRGELLSAEEDSNHDGKPDKWETYQAGALKTVAFDENKDGRPDRRLTYQGGNVVLIETEPDAAGVYSKRTDVR